MSLVLTPYKRNPTHTGKVLAVFIHGLGAPDTWVSAALDWKTKILQDSLLEGIDVGIVTYDTAHLVSGIFKFSGQIQLGKHKLTIDEGKFSNIADLAHELQREMGQRSLRPYKKIVLIGHSMGGLIGLHYILQELEHKDSISSIGGFISLATPYNGADLANFHKLIKIIQSHTQISDLSPNSEFLDSTSRLFNKYAQFPGIQEIDPRFYFGKADTIVTRGSAIPQAFSIWKGGLPLDGDHGSILDFTKPNSTVYREIQDYLLDVLDLCEEPTGASPQNVDSHQATPATIERGTNLNP
ncbi:lipase family alpha/beta hydrolase [Priestia aryabhattai]|uniref:lipase family alpha/beta hydrolase n=1 Tax=Priestia aryabhattai TaxID=412384 RepID=UPI000C073FA9|nr:alpha/beta fold hydrolase [Priestia aryabhattai]